jgi:RNA polymerase sigma factor (sigma-70 family)
VVAEDPPQTNGTRLPPELARLLTASGEAQVSRAWAAFLDAFHRLVLFAVRSAEADHDVVMDRYAYVLQELRKDDFRRLRRFDSMGKARFSTWLVVVTRRLVIDHRRMQYGRRADAGENADWNPQEERRRLVDLVASSVKLSKLANPGSGDLDRALREKEVHTALTEAVGALPHRDQLLLAMRFQDGLSARRIAESMGFASPFHVYRRLKSVLAGLRVELTKRGIDGSEP